MPKWVEAVLEFASVIAALLAAYYWYQSTRARAPYKDDGTFNISDDDAHGRYDVLETAKLQVRLNRPAALWAGISALFQGVALIAHMMIRT